LSTLCTSSKTSWKLTNWSKSTLLVQSQTPNISIPRCHFETDSRLPKYLEFSQINSKTQTNATIWCQTLFRTHPCRKLAKSQTQVRPLHVIKLLHRVKIGYNHSQPLCTTSSLSPLCSSIVPSTSNHSPWHHLILPWSPSHQLCKVHGICHMHFDINQMCTL
jgi:hypothetical protein